MNDTAARVRQFKQELAQALEESGRPPGSVAVVAVSKTHPAEAVVEAVLAGMNQIGENRVQEMQTKRPIVEELLRSRGADIRLLRWHMVGRLQSNKAAKAARLFDVIQSFDNLKTARLVSKGAEELGRRVDAFLEVNTSGEASKAGVSEGGAARLALELAGLPGLRLRGLMTVGPLTDDQQEIRSAFYRLALLRDNLKQDLGDRFDGELSMGMSGDWRLAVAAGATVIRVGTAIFGERTPKFNP